MLDYAFVDDHKIFRTSIVSNNVKYVLLFVVKRVEQLACRILIDIYIVFGVSLGFISCCEVAVEDQLFEIAKEQNIKSVRKIR